MKEMIITLCILFLLGNYAYSIVHYYIERYVNNSKKECPCNNHKSRYLFFLLFASYFSHSSGCPERSTINLVLFSVILCINLILGYFLFMQDTSNVLLYFLIYTLICIALIDLFTYTIPNILVLFLFILALLKNILSLDNILINLSISILVCFLFIVINWLTRTIAKKDAIGYGDIKLLFTLNFFFGYQLFFIGLWLSSLIAIPGFLFIKRLSSLHAGEIKIPFGFFLANVFLIIAFSNRTFINLYYKMMGV